MLIQLADMAAFLLRRYAQVRSGLVRPKYADEPERLTAWMLAFSSRAITPAVYLQQGRQYAEDLFYQLAPQAIRDL